MKKARYESFQAHGDWTLEDWKNVIWADETSIVLGRRRGGTRVRRAVEDKYNLM
jgi:hypothetical protein